MNKDLIDITVVLDRSGSMQACKDDATGGLNSFINSQKSQPGRANLTLVQFDDKVEFMYDGKDIMEVKHVSLQPRGMTAMYDAIGQAISATGKRLEAIPEEDRPGGVIFVILTDGYENASKEFSAAQIKDMITHQQEKYNWQFTYLGANQDAVLVGTGLGITRDASATYAVMNMGATFNATATGVSMMRDNMSKGINASFSYTDKDRADMVN